MEEYDVLVIGGGPGGYAAALRAAGAGLKTAIVEKGKLGGACLNRGCVPAKAWIAAAETVDHARLLNELSKTPLEYSPDFSKILERERKIVGQFRKSLEALLDKKGVDVHRGSGAFASPSEVTVGGAGKLAFKSAVIATGTAPATLFGLSSDHALDTDTIFGMETLPKSMLIVGAGVAGCEFAGVFSRLGVEITMLELEKSVLPRMDGDISKVMARELGKLKVKVMTGAVITSAGAGEGFAFATLEDGSRLEAERIFITIGRSSPTGALGLDKAGVKTRENGSILVDEDYRTTAKGIYAVGDIAGKHLLAYTAYREGAYVADRIAGKEADKDFGPVPYALFTIPEAGAVGLRQEDAPAGHKVGSFMFRGLARAHATGEIAGMVKVIADGATDRILGVHMIGPRSTDMIHIAAAAMKAGMTATGLGGMLFAHPTLAEGLLEAVHDVHSKALHK